MDYRPKGADEIRRNMSAIRSRDNKTELALRRAIHALGLRYRLHSNAVMGRPDLIFPRARVAVFVDGDFWHARKLREQGPKAVSESIRTPSQAYWLSKFTRRVERDDEVNEELRADGWLVLRYWESDIKKSVEVTALAIAKRVRSRAGRLPPRPKGPNRKGGR
jgi:DNA mismatch endonuclease, patch repair protein